MIKINNLIKKLNEIKDIRGNVEVRILSPYDNPMDTCTLAFSDICGNLVAIGETAVGKAKKFPTAKQTYTINLILKYVPGTSFTGRTKEDAINFITEHKHKVPVGCKIDFSDYVISFPTPKQIGYINSLEEKNEVPFTGTTFKEATEYIKKYGNTKNTPKQEEHTNFCQMVDEDEIPF